jgi:hypothetical protein
VPGLIRAWNDTFADRRHSFRQTGVRGVLTPWPPTPSSEDLLVDEEVDACREAAVALKRVDPAAARRAGVR